MPPTFRSVTKVNFRSLIKNKPNLQLLLTLGKEPYIDNEIYNTVPLIFHGNRNGRQILETLSRYLLKTWNPVDGCLTCLDDTRSIKKIKVSKKVVQLLN